jgi:uncharacterized protein (TIGR01319 family)
MDTRSADALVFEIGSTTTVVSAFDRLAAGEMPRLVGQGTAATTVADGDVTIGANAARDDLQERLGYRIRPIITLATSSAAGGLRMTVHGLTQRMTAMAAREAALGAGGVVEYVTAGKLREADLAKIEEVRPNLILLAGGVEGGDYETVLFNAEQLTKLQARPIVVYGGNSIVCADAQQLLEAAGYRVRITANVYPSVDELDIVPARMTVLEYRRKKYACRPCEGAMATAPMPALSRKIQMPHPVGVRQSHSIRMNMTLATMPEFQNIRQGTFSVAVSTRVMMTSTAKASAEPSA